MHSRALHALQIIVCSTLLTYSLHAAQSFLRSYLILQLLKNFPAFLEPEGSSSYSQVPATCRYAEPILSSPHKPLPLPEYPSQYYSLICVWVSPVVSFPQVSPAEPFAPLSSSPQVPHAPSISFFSILPPAQYSVRITDH